MTVVLEGQDLARTYDVSRGLFGKQANVQALAGVSFQLEAGKTLAVVGESGSGKSTLARLVTLIEPPTSGRLMIDGKDVTEADAETRQAMRQRIQMVFQNPYGSLNPRQRVGKALEEPLLVHTKLTPAERTERARAMMARVGLRPEFYNRYPHMFSGGQRQRIAIARALMLRPPILVLDEPVSALDVSIRAQVLNLLAELQEEFGTAYLFISHDLSVVRHIADRVMVMYLGRAAEIGARDAIFTKARHPYTRALLSATPSVDPAAKAKKERIILQGELPSPFDPPAGCAFNPRCPEVIDRCRVDRPEMKGDAVQADACWVSQNRRRTT
jgi:dipeptide transport system ATP-binding protein